LLESDLDDGGVDAEKYRPNLVRRRAVAYADGGEDDTTKSYDVGEAVVLVHREGRALRLASRMR
jgi:hypothetical protein